MHHFHKISDGQREYLTKARNILFIATHSCQRLQIVIYFIDRQN